MRDNEEPDAGNPHVRICGSPGEQSPGPPDNSDSLGLGVSEFPYSDEVTDVCDPADGVCIEPRALRDACHFDIQCQSRNCSNDGDSAKVGVCHQKLGTDCDANDEAPTCNDCRSAGPGILGTCTRRVCNPADGP